MLPRVPNKSSCALILLVMAVACANWGCPSAANFLPKSVRWFLFANYGANKICPEMLKRSVMLRLSERQNGIGRFFPIGCNYNVDNAAETVTVHVTGTGYGWMSPAKRVGFSITTSVEYRSDFQVAGDDAYVWAKLNRIVQGPNFQLGYVENPILDIAANLPGIGSLANFFGDQIVKGEMTRGFTVLHNLDTEQNEFSLGILYPPQRPVQTVQRLGVEPADLRQRDGRDPQQPARLPRPVRDRHRQPGPLPDAQRRRAAGRRDDRQQADRRRVARGVPDRQADGRTARPGPRRRAALPGHQRHAPLSAVAGPVLRGRGQHQLGRHHGAAGVNPQSARRRGGYGQLRRPARRVVPAIRASPVACCLFPPLQTGDLLPVAC